MPRFLALALSLAAALALALALWPHAAGDRTLYTAPGLEPMAPETAAQEAYRLAPALLLAVYEAFGETGEAEVYDRLAEVAAGAALHALYLERAGALAESGLSADSQLLHQITMTRLRSARDGNRLQLDAEWIVVGTVGHATHLHVRGNSYRAALTVAPADGAWKIAAFELIDVRRDRAGEITEGDDE